MMLDCYESLKADTEKSKRRAENRKHKLAVETIEKYIVAGNIKQSIDIAEKYNIDSKEFGTITASLKKRGLIK
jgi:hypothetical protein